MNDLETELCRDILRLTVEAEERGFNAVADLLRQSVGFDPKPLNLVRT